MNCALPSSAHHPSPALSSHAELLQFFRVLGAFAVLAIGPILLAATAPHHPLANRAAPGVLIAPAPRHRVARNLINLPWAFEPNVGQANPRVKYLARASNSSVFLAPSGPVIAWNAPETREAGHAASENFMSLSFVGANPSPRLTGVGPLPGRTNYFLGRDPREWHTGVPHFAAVRYANLYPGISARFYGGWRGLEYDLVLSPDVNLRAVKLQVHGAERLTLLADGGILLRAAGRAVIMRRPVIYQPQGSARIPVSGGYKLLGHTSFEFIVGRHRADLPLVIDPSMSIPFTTFLGGAGAEKGNSVVADSSGNAYVGGSTSSPASFPGTATLNQVPSAATSNLFVAKINMSTNPPSLVYLTFIGGSGEDEGGNLALDNSVSPPDLAIVGWTTSGDFPVTDGSSLNGPSDLTVTKLNGAGNGFIYSKYFGGSNAEATENGAGIATDAAGDVFVTSDTTSVDLPQPAAANGFQTAFEAGTTPGTNPPTNDGFLAEFAAANPSPGALVYSTYFGVNATVAGTSVAVDSTGDAYIAGYTSQPNAGTFPTSNGFESTYGGGPFDAFLIKINPAAAGASSLVFSTFLGGSGSDQALALALDSASPPKIYVTGTTSSPDFTSIATPTNAPYQSTLAPSASGNAFLAVINQSALPLTLQYVTYLGGTQTDSAHGLAVVSPSDVLVSGDAASPDFPIFCSLQGFSGSQDAFVAAFNPTVGGAASLLYGNLLGGSSTAEANAVATDAAGDAILFGDTLSPDYPLAMNPGTGFQPICASCGATPPLSDAFLTVVASSSTPQACAAFDPAAAFLGAANVGSQSAVPFDGELINNGNQPLNIAGLSIVGANQSDFSLSIDTCPAASPLAPGAACSFEINFTPSIGGKESANLQVSDDGVGSPQSLALYGTGNAPGVTLSASSVNFGDVPENATSYQSVTLTNSGNQALTFNSITIDPNVGLSTDFSFTKSSDTCVGLASLNSGESCLIPVSFTPPSIGSVTAQVDISDNANAHPGSVQTIALSGTGTPPIPIVNLAPTSISFGSQTLGGSTAAHSLTLTNTGTAVLTLSNLSLAGADPGDFQFAPAGTTCQTGGSGVAANGGSCTIAVVFSPQLTGARNAEISISDNASPPTQTVPLTGTGTAAGASLSASSLTFAAQNLGSASAPQKVTLLNNGTGPLTISGISFTGADPSSFSQTNNCPSSSATLNSGASCVIQVTFAPPAAGSLSATLAFTDNAPGSPQTVSLSGTGIASAVEFSPSPLQFSATLVGTSAGSTPVTVKNLTSNSLVVSSVTFSGLNAADFQESDNCTGGSGVPAGSTCTINVNFQPQAAGARSAAFQLNDSATGSPQTLSISGSATDFRLGAAPGGSTSASVVSGQSAVFNLQVNPVDGFTGDVSLSCGSVPGGGSCNLSASSVTISGASPSAFTVSISAPANSILAQPPSGNAPHIPWRGIFLFGLLIFSLVLLLAPASRRGGRYWRPVLLGAVLLLASCAGGGGGSSADPQPTTYTVIITGTSSGAMRPLNLTITVTP